MKTTPYCAFDVILSCIQYGHIDIAIELLIREKDALSYDNYESIIYVACITGTKRIIETIAEIDHLKQHLTEYTYLNACESPDIPTAEYIIRKYMCAHIIGPRDPYYYTYFGDDPSEKLEDGLTMCCRKGHPAVADFIMRYSMELKGSINIHRDRELMFISCCSYGNLPMLRWILKFDGRVKIHCRSDAGLIKMCVNQPDYFALFARSPERFQRLLLFLGQVFRHFDEYFHPLVAAVTAAKIHNRISK